MPTKDLPLLLRRRATGRDDDGTPTGTALFLDARPGERPQWPPRHEFTNDWLLRAVSDGSAKVTENTVELTFANAHATYRIVDDAEHGANIGEPHVRSDTDQLVSGYRSTGVWGYLIEGKVD